MDEIKQIQDLQKMVDLMVQATANANASAPSPAPGLTNADVDHLAANLATLSSEIHRRLLAMQTYDPSRTQKPGDSSSDIPILTLDDVRGMSVSEIQARWTEVEKVLKAAK